MEYVKESSFYKDAIQELKYPFGIYYLFDGFIIAEINEGVLYTWDYHGKIVAADIAELYENDGRDIVYISNRIHSYAVKPSDWIKFYSNNYKLRAYAVVSNTKRGRLNMLIEKLFMKNRIQSFDNLTDAISWAKSLAPKVHKNS
ncbi:hypothetical protein [Aquimarina sp. MMG016]|uniref:hypothetical protein n=1 Tax=Aquimarina sp. MMG016 TaxID=2822690 RepID=UPI001B39D816|nr:hypothetical protein [Aquimarina sp. MMG016]MBQ4822598.1 hypothetical protein [Aquimarina sp. MMG016]